jgi:ATP-dependent Clp protease ATP-binding subunit ClpB
VQLVTDAVVRARSGITSPTRPIGSFVFLGPTGVGKTELAKALAEALFDSEENIIRIDMSEYQERHTVSRLVGAPPGYVGFEEGGQLTEAVRRRHYAVILLDEIEKAHVDVFNLLLQVLDDGRLTDSHGRTVDFRNTVIIMTSNLGSEYLLDGATRDGEVVAEARTLVMSSLRAHFRPEFLNRIDEIVLFKPLTFTEIEHIVDLQLHDLRERLAEQRITLEVTEQAQRFIAEQGFDPAYGARPLRRFIAREVETRVARALLSGDLPEDSTIVVDRVDEQLTVVPSQPDREQAAACARSCEARCQWLSVRTAARRIACPPRRTVHLHVETVRTRFRGWSTRPTRTSQQWRMKRRSLCSSTSGLPGVGHAEWSPPFWSNWRGSSSAS